MISVYYEFMTFQATHLFVVPSTQAKINYTRSTDYFYGYSTSKVSIKTTDIIKSSDCYTSSILHPAILYWYTALWSAKMTGPLNCEVHNIRWFVINIEP